MAGNITVTGQKKIATLQKEFTAEFPHLAIMLFSEEEYEKSQRGDKVRPLSGDQTIAAVRTKKNTEDLSIHGSTYIGTLEETFLSGYGLRAQVCFKRDGKRKYTDESFDGHSLSKIERIAHTKGWDSWG